MIEEHVLEDILRNTCLDKSLNQPLAHQQRLRRMFQDNGIACHQRRSDGVDRRHIRVVPRGDHEHDAMRFTLDTALELVATFDNKRRQRVGSDRRDIVGALVEAPIFATILDRPTHLPGELRYDEIGHLVEPRDAFEHKLHAILQRPLRPGRLRLAGTGDNVLSRL